jgi:quinohemoprotein ethanol dehydrogenase
VNRGVAYGNGKIFVAPLDGRLIALDVKTGEVVWQTETTDPNGGQTVTGAPRAFAGKVIIGQGGADFGMRGYVTAYEQATGKQVWRFYVVPGSPEQNYGDPAMEAAAKTWSADFWKKAGGGGGPWDSITYDAELNRIYIGTRQRLCLQSDERSPGNGDNLYTASIVALDASTGKYLWHYQVNPRDSWDFDATQQMALATLTVGGRPHRVLMQAPKNGFFYVIDRDTGKLLSAEKLGRVTWAERIDLKTGRPIEAANVRYDQGEFTMFPSTIGAHSWMRMSYSPRTRLMYVPFINLGTRFHRGAPDADDLALGGADMAYDTSDPGPKGALIAWDPVAQKQHWRVPFTTYWNGGALATAGNVVFMGGGDGWFNAFDAATGTRLWRSYAAMGIMAAPTSYSIGGKQYVSVLAGYGGTAGSAPSSIMNVGWKYRGPRRLLTFALGGGQTLPASNPPTLAVKAQDNPAEVLDPQELQTGKLLFMACFSCHGRNLVSAGTAPDLRESAIPLDKDAFQQVVRGGALIQYGMPRFDTFTAAQVEALRQYIRSGAREAEATK